MWRKVSDPANPDVDENTWWRIFSADEEPLPKVLADWKKSSMCNMIQLKWARGQTCVSPTFPLSYNGPKNMARDQQPRTKVKSKTERRAPILFNKHRERAHLSKAMTPVTIILRTLVNCIPPTMSSPPHQ